MPLPPANAEQKEVVAMNDLAAHVEDGDLVGGMDKLDGNEVTFSPCPYTRGSFSPRVISIFTPSSSVVTPPDLGGDFRYITRGEPPSALPSSAAPPSEPPTPIEQLCETADLEHGAQQITVPIGGANLEDCKTKLNESTVATGEGTNFRRFFLEFPEFSEVFRCPPFWNLGSGAKIH